MNQRLLAAAGRFEDWVQNDALPLWQSVGIAKPSGAHYERLLPNGCPDTTCDVRVRVQARQMFVYAFSHQVGWLSDASQQVKTIQQFVENAARHPHAPCGYVHLLDASFKIKDERQDLYDHAFFILAYAWIYKAFKQWDALEKVEQLVTYLDKRFSSSVGGWNEGDYNYDRRRQNPHMHLFEAFLHMYSITRQSKWLARAAEIFSLFQTRFYDTKNQVLREYFDEQWMPLTCKAGEIVEPGHMLEWVWLLRWYERLSERSVAQYANPMFKHVISTGMSHSGLVYDAVDIHGNILDGKKRCWPMTELIKASIAQARVAPNGSRTYELEEHAAQAIENLLEFYLSCAKTPGAYIDQRDEKDRVLVNTAPASTLYHILLAAAEVKQYCGKRSFEDKKYNSDHNIVLAQSG